MDRKDECIGQLFVGWCIFVVEDEYFFVDDIGRLFCVFGVDVVGLVGYFEDVFIFVSDGCFLDVVVFDVNFGCDMIFFVV